ncbi:MAG: polyphosphate polymerase domain-containing protein [bacterium]|nr:polyphosphate polymerase domain-containing protein [bacterium]
MNTLHRSVRTKTKKRKPDMERYELKYTIPEYMINPISDYLSIYCSPDEYSEKSKDGFYRINNLYFDSDSFLFLRRKLNEVPDRFNMRIRSYGEHPRPPYFLEIKNKSIDIVKKYRAKTYTKQLENLFSEPGTQTSGSCCGDITPGILQFVSLAQTYNATPKILTQYDRRAFVSTVDDYARVTFDKNLCYQNHQNYSVVPNNSLMIPYDNTTLFDSGSTVILELKCPSLQVPYWMIDLVKTFNLKRRGFSKYATGVAEVLNQFQYDKSDRDSITGRQRLNIR